MATTKKQPTFVMVTTSRRLIVAGYLDGTASEAEVTLRDARCVLRWRGAKGFLGLALDGPNSQCRVGPAAPRLTLYGITSVTECTDAAREAWEKAPWAA